MTRKELVIITRPIEDARAFEAEVKKLGYRTFLEPMLVIKPVAIAPIDFLKYEALIFTSLQAVRALKDQNIDKNIMVFCVGASSELALKEQGFENIFCAQGDVNDLCDLLKTKIKRAQKPLLYLRGQEISKPLGPILSGYSLEELIVYHADRVDGFTTEFIKIMSTDEDMIVPFFSIRTAENFLKLSAKSGVLRHLNKIKVLCLSEAVLKCVQHHQWKGLYVSIKPDRQGILSVLEKGFEIMKDNIQQNDSKNPNINNAEEIIERFGGIRPMAKKMGVAVTTIQGWKKRNVIPANRRNELLQASKAHDVDLSGLLEGVALSTLTSSSPANENTTYEIPKPQQEAPKQKEELAAPVTAHPKLASTPKPSSARLSGDIAASLLEVEQKAFGKSVWMSVVLILITVAAMFFVLWPDSKGNTERIALIEHDVNGLKTAVFDADSTTPPAPNANPTLMERMSGFQTKAQEIQEQASASLDKAKELSADVMADDGSTIEQRLAKLQTHAIDALSDPRFEGLRARYSEMSSSLFGQQKLSQSVSELRAIIAGLGGNLEGLTPALEVARQQSPNLNESFEGVPQEDLKAAALLLGMSQFRQSLNRDNQPFDEDLALLKTLVGTDNPELTQALDKLAPKAKEGVLTPAGLSNEFKTVAGDVVVASLKGEDVSMQEQIQAKMNNLLQVEKNGELTTGTPTQKSLAQANSHLEKGDIAAAIAVVETLQGPEAAAIQPWLNKAQATLTAQNVKNFLQDHIVNQGTLIQNSEAGINIYTP